MASEGPRNSAYALNEASIGAFPWYHPSRVYLSDDSRAVTWNPSPDLYVPSGISYYLKCMNFNFFIPAGATIDGIELRVEKRNYNGYVYDNSIRLVKNNAIGGDNKANGTAFWPWTEAVSVYGGPTDLWGLSWTPSDINSFYFGAVISSRHIQSAYGYIDYISLTVYYTIHTTAVPTTPVPTTAAPTAPPTTIPPIPTTLVPTTTLTTVVPTTPIPPDGTVCWGHDTAVVEANIRNLTGNWAGTASIAGAGDAEEVQFSSGEDSVSETWHIGPGRIKITLDKYGSGSGAPTVYYKQGNSSANCDSDSWHLYSGSFVNLGWVKVRIIV